MFSKKQAMLKKKTMGVKNRNSRQLVSENTKKLSVSILGQLFH